MSAEDPLTHASAEALTSALRQTADAELRVRAACAAGDQLRLGELAALPRDLREALCAATEDVGTDISSDLRFEAAIALCEAHDEAAAEVLLDALDDKHRRFDAVKALSRLRDERVKQALRRAASRLLWPWHDRLVASAACAVLGDSEGARYFERTLASRWFPSRRAMALHLLGELRHPEAFGVLLDIAEQPHDPWRAVAIRALGHLGDRRAVPRLRAFSGVEEDVEYALDLLT